MIGIIKDENSVTIQFWPIYGSDKGIPKWAEFRINTEPKSYGEYGIAWSNASNKIIPDIWICFGITTYTSFKAFYKAYKFKTLF